MDVGLIWAIGGSAFGVLGGVIGTYFSIRLLADWNGTAFNTALSPLLLSVTPAR